MKTTKRIQIISLTGVSLITFLLFAILSGCQSSEKEALKQENTKLQEQLVQTESLVDQLMTTFSEVEANLSLIKVKEGLIAVDSDNPELNLQRKDKILGDIRAINTLMEENKAKISDLQEQLSKSGLKVTNFEKKLKLLLAQLDQKEKDLLKMKDNLVTKDFEIALLNSSVDTLSNYVSSQTEMLMAQNSEIQNMDKALNASYFTGGTFQELKEKGVIEREGWTPWGGKKVELNENLSKDDFTEIDKRETTTIPIHAKKAVLVSEHPEGTYAFEKDDEGLIASLEITNPNEFWKISRYLVVEVK